MSLPATVFLICTGLLAGYVCHKAYSAYRIFKSRRRADRIIASAREDIESGSTAKKIEEHRGEIDSYRESLEKQIQSLEKRNSNLDSRLVELEERLENRREHASRVEEQVDEYQKELSEIRESYNEKNELVLNRLQDTAGLDRDEVLSELKDEIISETELKAKKRSKSYQKTIENQADRIARRVHGRVRPRCDIPSPADVPSAALKFPDQEAYESLKDFYDEHEEQLVETINSDIRFEDDKQLAVIENMEPVQKEIAYRTVNNVVQQKKFNFDLIENGVEKYQHRVRQDQMEAARKALRRCNVDDVPEELVELLGVLSFRTSYGQPQLLHSIEVSLLSSLMAAEIGADPELARRAGLLHDVGKAVDRQRDSGHADISGELAEEQAESEIVVNALKSHHGDYDPNSVESILVAAADAISGSRPGARKENITDYSERIENLRELAKSRPGIQKVYAMSAGRELRIWVDNRQVSDSEMPDLAAEVARDIEENLTYSGEIKVNTIREKKVIETAHIS